MKNFKIFQDSFGKITIVKKKLDSKKYQHVAISKQESKYFNRKKE